MLKKKFQKRSLKANAYYWGVVIPLIMAEMGENDEGYVHAKRDDDTPVISVSF